MRAKPKEDQKNDQAAIVEVLTQLNISDAGMTSTVLQDQPMAHWL